MKPQERFCKWQCSNPTDAARLHDNMLNIVSPDYIHIAHIHTIIEHTCVTYKVSTSVMQNKYLFRVYDFG